jgi:type IV secretory pathway VirB3-like protein
MLKMLLGPIAELVTGFLKNKAEEKKLRHQAKMQAISNGAEWEAKMADASASSWKDEFWTLVLAAPVFMIGYAIAMNDVAVIERVDLAFAALDTLPEWYQYLLFLAVSASFGIRGADKLMQLRKK